MMIPAFSAAGVLPPFVGDAAASAPRSPYVAGSRDVVQRFATSAKRCEILRGWLAHRAALHALGFLQGFQWLNGSFCEQLVSREPNDIDLVTFFVRPSSADLRSLVARHRQVFDRTLTKNQYLCDAFFVELHGGRFADPRQVSYWYSLFSHRRNDLVWKGILEVPLEPTDDASAANDLVQATSSLTASAAP